MRIDEACGLQGECSVPWQRHWYRVPLDSRTQIKRHHGPDDAPFDLAKTKEILATFANNKGKMRTLFPERLKAGDKTSAAPAKWNKRADFGVPETSPSTASTK